MNHLNNEIKLTIALMEGCTDDRAHNVLQSHLYSLLEMKREWLVTEAELQSEHQNEAKPLTTEELRAGGWSCADVSRECAYAFKSKGLNVANTADWGTGEWVYCVMDECHNSVVRCFYVQENEKRIYRIGNEFYWCISN